MRTIAIANQKGGCGKTTTAVNLAAALAMAGQRTVLIDLDPQAHATLAFGFEPARLDKTIYHVIRPAQLPISGTTLSLGRAVLQTSLAGLDLVPSNILLSGLEFEIACQTDREYLLHRQLGTISDRYDVCIIDCSPSLCLLTLNALVAGTDLIIPVQTQYYALEGLKQLFETVAIVNDRFNPYLNVLGILLTFVEKTTALSKEVERQLRQFFGDLVFDTVIHRTTRLAEAPSAGMPILTYAPNNRGAAEYRTLAEEVLCRWMGTTVPGRLACPWRSGASAAVAVE